jgi:hypothetical protein
MSAVGRCFSRVVCIIGHYALGAGVQKLASNQAVLPWLQGHGSERLSKNRSEETGR